jgi:hypothetical protein
VANRGSNAVARFDHDTGAFLGALVTLGSGGLTEPKGMAFGPDRNLYIGNEFNHSILKFAGDTGAFLGTFAPAGAYLRYPSRIVFTPPRVTIMPGNHRVTIRWPAMYGHLRLMSKSAFSPSATWTPMSEPATVVENDYVVTQPCFDVSSFFRLQAR